MDYKPPFTITSTMLSLVGSISELVGHVQALSSSASPFLRRENRIRTIHASLAIENNTLSLEQVTAVLCGKHVLGQPHEIQEVRNAFLAYERMESWNPCACEDLLAAHGLLLAGLVAHPGHFRRGGVGIFQGNRVVHMAPPASLVSGHIERLLSWLAVSADHPLVTSCVFHYEFEFIHPFEDGNGRMGRLWQTLILSRWKPLFAFLPVETVIRARQKEYYDALAQADAVGESTPFIEFLLGVLYTALQESAVTSPRTTVDSCMRNSAEDVAGDPAGDPDKDPAGDSIDTFLWRLLQLFLKKDVQSLSEMMAGLGRVHKRSFRQHYLDPALRLELLERTLPDKPSSPLQAYRLTMKGRQLLKQKRQVGAENSVVLRG